MGPPIAAASSRRSTISNSTKTIRDGNPRQGHAAYVVADSEMAAPRASSCARFSGAANRRRSCGWRLQTTDGRSLEGQVLGEGFDDVQLRTDDKRVHLLRRAGDRFGP